MGLVEIDKQQIKENPTKSWVSNFLLQEIMVRSERLELSHLSAPEPKSGASTNSATTAASLLL